jgi:cold shock CspA family protein
MMDGKVKWFSKEKGYGYIIGEGDVEYYFNIRDIKGGELPNNGDRVNFCATKGHKGPRAATVEITTRVVHSNSAEKGHSDDRATCLHCNKRMIPRIITQNGEPKKSVCPFCGETYKNFGCFIATAVYGDHYAPEVIALRRFRDETLESSAFGKAFISFYYLYSPPVADFLINHPILSAMVRLPLNFLAKRNS